MSITEYAHITNKKEEKEINSQSNASHHLSKLRNTDLVESRQKKQWVYYSISKKSLKKFPFIEELFTELQDLDSCQQYFGSREETKRVDSYSCFKLVN